MRTRLILAVMALSLTATTAAAQNPGASPGYGDVRLSAGFLPDPHVVDLTAGGSVEVDVGRCSYGYVANAPDVDLYYDANGSTNLYIYVTAGDDTTLLINMPDGSWVCNDDGLGNRNPVVVIPAAPGGLYDIWVGTYGTDLVSARLHITEIDPR